MGKGVSKRLFKGDKTIWIIFASLCILSMIEVFSATSTLTYKTQSYWQPITQHVTFLLAGVAIAWFVHNMPFTWFKKGSYVIYLLGVILLICVLFRGGEINSSARWLPIMGVRFQPSELGKLGIVMITALLLANGQTEKGTEKGVMKRILIATALVCMFIITENLSTVLLIGFTIIIMMFVGRVPGKQMWQLIGITTLVGIVAVSAIMYTPSESVRNTRFERIITWKSRIKSFTDADDAVPPEKYVITGREQRTHANIAIATSSFFGKGPGNSVERDFLSQAYSDFIYALIIEELGLIGGIVVIFLYLVLLYHTGQIAGRCEDSFASFLIIGSALMIVTHAMAHMSISVGLGPVSGQPLPLVSRGGTSIIINSIYIGMILSVSRYVRSLEKLKSENEEIPFDQQIVEEK